MSEMMNLQGSRITGRIRVNDKVFTWTGTVTLETALFLWLKDERSGQLKILNKNELLEVDVHDNHIQQRLSQ